MAESKPRPPMVCEPIHGPLPDWEQPFVKPSALLYDPSHAGVTARGFTHVLTGVTVLVSGSVEEDGKRWIHVSFAHRHRLPTWEEMAAIKHDFIGEDRKAILVLPPKAEHVNINPNCLHIWHCLDGDGLPDFLRGRPKGHL